MPSLSTTVRRGAVAAVLSAALLTSVLATGVVGAAATKEDDQGVNVTFEGSDGTSIPELAIADGSMAKALKPLGATATAVGNYTALAPAVEAIQAGALDIANGSITATVGSLSGGATIKAFTYTPDGTEGEAILVKKGSGITSVKDLVGKTVAVNQGGTGQYLLDQALSYNHIPISEVNQVYLLAPAGEQAFEAGSVDAWATFSTFIPLAEQDDDAQVLVTGGQVQSHNDTDYVVASSFAAKYPHLLKVIYGVIRAEADKVKDNPKAYDAAVVTADQLAPAEVKFLNSQDQVPQPITPAVTARWQKVADFFFKAGGVPSAVAIAPNVIDVDNLP